MLSRDDAKRLIIIANEAIPAKTGLQKESERVAQLRSVSIYIYPNEGGHKMPHFHAWFNDSESAVFSIDPFEVMPGTICTLRKSQYKAVLKWAQEPVGGPKATEGTAAQPNAKAAPTRLEALRAAWDQARSGGRIIHIASGRGTFTESTDAEAVIANITPQVYSLMMNRPWQAFADFFRIELLHHACVAGVSPDKAKPVIERVLKRIEEAVWEASKVK